MTGNNIFRTLRGGLLCLLAVMLLSVAATGAATEAREPLDYSDAANWVYMGTEDGETKADVFFIAPSSFGGKEGAYIMDLSNESTREKFAGGINMEKGIYDGGTRFYAPYYRQTGYRVFALPDAEGEPLKLFAYADVKDAFVYYMEHLNNGRPFILAGFSQGGEMAIRLMKELFSDATLQDQLIACYAIGWRLTQEETEAYPWLCAAQSATDFGVIICFTAEAESVQDSLIIPAGMKSFAINPLSWKTDGEKADKSLNAGACFTNFQGEIESEVPALTGAYLDPVRGALKVTDIDPAVYNKTLPVFKEPGTYHLYDYQFFYRNLQQNVQDRVAAYLAAVENADAKDVAAAR